MNVTFTATAWKQYCYWRSADRSIVAKINGLIKECQRTPLVGTGKPVALKGSYSGKWSRRINREHRLVYKVNEATLIIIQCRYHY